MLSPMGDKLDVRLCGYSIDLAHLDIAAYLSAPHRINICNKQAWTVCRMFIGLFDTR
jgi:hypothetical protein